MAVYWNAKNGAGYLPILLANNNLRVDNSDAGYTGAWAYVYLNVVVTTKVYFEFYVSSVTPANITTIIAPADQAPATALNSAPNKGISVGGDGYFYSDNLPNYNQFGTGGFTAAQCIALDPINGKLWARSNAGNWNLNGSDNPTTNTGGVNISGFGKVLTVIGASKFPDAWLDAKFASAHFIQSAPSGFTPIPNRRMIITG